uniref:C2H2-type domain-containing protein n=1 Tax=Ananas comosus var. bracteatus TaxID=296719 RepID=A0A6V7PKP0_ANACO|nr:unnamed protein product [Ananas comosus var. bracteatus]
MALLVAEKSPQRPQGDDGGSSENKITRDNRTAGGGDGGGAMGKLSRKTGSTNQRTSASSLQGQRQGWRRSGAHTCEKCGRTFATGQSLGGHMRKHYEGPLIITNKKRAREQREETPAPAAERKVRMVSYFNGPFLESHNPALLSQSEQASDAGDYGLSGIGACRLHNFFPNELAEPEEEPKNAPQPEPERKDDDGNDDELLSLRLGWRWSGV